MERGLVLLDYFLLIRGIAFPGASLIFAVRIAHFFLICFLFLNT